MTYENNDHELLLHGNDNNSNITGLIKKCTAPIK